MVWIRVLLCRSANTARSTDAIVRHPAFRKLSTQKHRASPVFAAPTCVRNICSKVISFYYFSLQRTHTRCYSRHSKIRRALRTVRFAKGASHPRWCHYCPLYTKQGKKKKSRPVWSNHADTRDECIVLDGNYSSRKAEPSRKSWTSDNGFKKHLDDTISTGIAKARATYKYRQIKHSRCRVFRYIFFCLERTALSRR